MEKYGVTEEPGDDKTADDREETCPKCGSVLSDIQQTGVRHCPKCGTEPFEVFEIR
jgi:predicted  nucleic acid-binding Zn-ribbon protein